MASIDYSRMHAYMGRGSTQEGICPVNAVSLCLQGTHAPQAYQKGGPGWKGSRRGDVCMDLHKQYSQSHLSYAGQQEMTQ